MKNWIDQGIIYGESATTPTPILLNNQTIRVYAGFPDNKGVSRIGYVDVAAQNPKKILRVSKKPVLDIGKPGMFDDNGVILGDIVRVGSALRMYYVGFQHVQKVKFLAFSGLAVSRDRGETFTRVSDTPIFDRALHGYYFRAIHSLLRVKNHWKIWYAAGCSWQIIAGKPYPSYAIYYTESNDGKTFFGKNICCIKPTGSQYRIGRPRVYKTKSGFEMYYTAGTTDQKFFSGHAVSRDGIHWKRTDDTFALMYPALLRYHRTTYMFYNSKNFGAGGFGYATL